MSTLSFRFAEEKDAAKILFFIKELASYEKMLDEVVATEELLKELLDVFGTRRHLSGGLIRPERTARQRLRKGDSKGTCPNRRGARLRTP